VLDAVLADAADLRRNISRGDQHKLDEYLDSVRDVEQRIENAGKKGELQGWRPTLEKPNIPRPADGIPQDIAEHMRLMCDILVLGFQTDTTPMSNDIGSFARVAGSSDPSTLDITVLVAKADAVPAPGDLVHRFDPGADVCTDRSTQSGYETINGVAEVLLIDGCGAGGEDSNVVMAIYPPAQQSVILIAAKGPGPSNTDLLDFAQAVGESVVIL
jgi:hypothetical protein